MYVRVWEYEVPPASVDDFVAAYGADGDWAALFAHGPGYLGTELYRSTDDPARFVTVDRWTDATDWNSFRTKHGEQYEALDARLGRLGAEESRLLDGDVD